MDQSTGYLRPPILISDGRISEVGSETSWASHRPASEMSHSLAPAMDGDWPLVLPRGLSRALDSGGPRTDTTHWGWIRGTETDSRGQALVSHGLIADAFSPSLGKKTHLAQLASYNGVRSKSAVLGKPKENIHAT